MEYVTIENKNEVDVTLDVSCSECNKDLKFTVRTSNKGVVLIFVDPCNCTKEERNNDRETN